MVRELHDQLGPIRHELYTFGDMVRMETDQVRLERETTRIQEAFAAIVPASREPTGWRVLARVRALAKPLSKAYGIAINPTLLDPEKLRELMGSAHQAVTENVSLVDRTMSSRAFSTLLRTGAVTSLLKRHFTSSELTALEKFFGSSQARSMKAQQ